MQYSIVNLREVRFDNDLFRFDAEFFKCDSAILIMEIVLILQANMGCLHDGYRD